MALGRRRRGRGGGRGRQRLAFGVRPRRGWAELLVAQLAYHQSCTRLLTSVTPHVSELLASAESMKMAQLQLNQEPGGVGHGGGATEASEQ